MPVFGAAFELPQSMHIAAGVFAVIQVVIGSPKVMDKDAFELGQNPAHRHAFITALFAVGIKGKSRSAKTM